MRLSQLNGLVLIHKYGSISKAAQETYTSQSALSVSIKELEEELDNTILIRTKKGVSFTDYGLQVLEYATRILDDVQAIKRLEGNKNVICGNIALGTTSYFSNVFAIKILLNIKEHFPGINLKLHQNKNANVISDVLLGKLDLGLLQVGMADDKFYTPQELIKSKLEFHHLFERSMKLAVSEKHPLCHKKIQIKDLFSYPYITSKNLEEDFVYQKLKTLGYTNDVIQMNETGMRSLIYETNGFHAVVDLGLKLGNQQYKDKLVALDVQDFSAKYIIGWISKPHPFSIVEEKVIQVLNDEAKCYCETIEDIYE